jgi:PAS domain S-box-containing protein
MDRELEWRVPERTRELEEANEALRQSQEMLARELDAAQRLHHVATELISARGTQALYEQILDTAMAILQADFASIQRFHPEVGPKGELHLLSYRGFNAEVARIWEWIAPTRATTCGQALRTRGRVMVPDVRHSDFMASTYDLEEYLGAGVLAAQTTPLVSRSGALLGMVSTYWREPHQMSVTEVRSMDVLARLAADLSERASAEEKLSESEERFRNLADAAPVMIWVVGPDKRATFFNKRCLDFTGTTMEQKLGNGWVSYLHDEDRERFLGIYSSSIEARQEFRSVVRLRRADGEYGWVLCSGVPRFVSRGVFSGYIGSCIEITDQKLTEEGLRASEVRLMAAQHLARVGSWERDIDGATIYWSQEMRRIFGLPNAPPADLSTFLKYVHPKDRPKVCEVDSQVRSSSAPVDTEYRIVRPDGEARFIRSIVEAVRDDQGQPVRITEAIQDITEQVTARELLRESEQHLKKAERLAKVGHWQWDLRTNRVSGSDEMYRIFGKQSDFIPSYTSFLEELVPPDGEELQRLIQDSLTRKLGHSLEYRIAHTGGDVRTISCIWEVLLDEEGEPVRLFGTCQDITDSRRAQEEAFARQKL